MKVVSDLPLQSFKSHFRSQFSPIKGLTPESLVTILDAFHKGHLKAAALLWESIEQRDDVIRGVSLKRKKAIARLRWDILTLDSSEEALQHKQALEYFYNNLTASNALDENEKGGLSLLVKQMMDSAGKRYAVHEIIFQPHLQPDQKYLTADFRFVPLWFFENTEGKLKFVSPHNPAASIALKEGEWLVTTNDGLMEATSIAYLFKHLPLKDWLIYSERNGMPGVKGITDASPGSEAWNGAREAVQNFGAEFCALMSRGTDIQTIDLTTKGDLPYPMLIERMDRAIIALWRGSDLTTFSKAHGHGASLQDEEAILLEQDDAALISETLNTKVDRVVLNYLFNTERGKAYIRLQPTDRKNRTEELQLYKQLWQMGVPISLETLAEKLAIMLPRPTDTVLQPPSLVN
jgi:phage gp29-like protein